MPTRACRRSAQRRIHWVLFVLRSQRFYGPGRSSERKPGQPEPHGFIFESCALRRSMRFAIACQRYLNFSKLSRSLNWRSKTNTERRTARSRSLSGFDESELSAEQLALLPTSMVCLRDGRTGPAETVQAFEALASGLPIKVLIQTDDILGGTSPEPSRTAFGVGSARIAAMAIGLNSAFVYQASSAHLCRTRASSNLRHAL